MTVRSGRVFCRIAYLILGLASSASANDVRVGFGSSCPPNGYAYIDATTGMLVKPVQPAYDFDLDGNGVDDSWSTALTLLKPGGGNFATTDECGNSICLPCIPDPAGDGCGLDFYSPRLKIAGGAAEGIKVGKCHYTYGRNLWKLCITDSDGDCTPDKFSKITWRSRDAGSNDPTSRCFSATAGDMIYYVTSVVGGKVIVIKVRKPASLAGGTPFVVDDAKFVNFGDDPTGIILGGSLLPSPLSAFEGTGEPVRNQDDDDQAQATNTLQIPSGLASPGAVFTVDGVLTNLGPSSNSFGFDLAAVNATILTDPASLTANLGPGVSQPYQFQIQVQGNGPVGIVSLTFTRSGEPESVDLDGVTLQGLPPTDVPTVSAWGMVFLAAAFLVMGAFFARRPASQCS